VAELRRLLIRQPRLEPCLLSSRLVPLQEREAHYLRRVLRLRIGDPVAVVNGQGQLWTASLRSTAELELDQSTPQISGPNPCPRLGLAVVGVRRGMDELMRMACELGIDWIQPLTSQWRTVQADERPDRWQLILDEAVEQCERLWQPTLLASRDVTAWWQERPGAMAGALATTRRSGLPSLRQWLEQQPTAVESVWVTIGPEAGWSPEEEAVAETCGWTPISCGSTILRTSTAAVSAAALMASWREHGCC
jgi:16S rRNA (uracil1498-N3)-methyltransferase